MSFHFLSGALRTGLGLLSLLAPLARMSAQAPSSTSTDIGEAYRLIDAAATNARRIPSYVTISVEEFSKGTNKRTRWVRNGSNGVQYLRVEQTLQLAKTEPQTAIFVQNGDTFWQLYNNAVIKLLIPFPMDRPIPRRLGTAQQLCFQHGIDYDQTKHLNCLIERNADFFGMPCTRISISISPELAALLPHSAQPKIPDPKKPSTTPRPEPAASYVYFIDNTTPFIVSWQAFDQSGKKISDVNYQDFRVEPKLADTLFEVPSGTKTVIARNKAEYIAALKLLSPSAPEIIKK